MSFLEEIDAVDDTVRHVKSSDRRVLCRNMSRKLEATDEAGHPCNCPRRHLYMCRTKGNVRGYMCEWCDSFELMDESMMAAAGLPV